MKKILILANNAGGLYRFRKELIEELINIGYEVYLSVPYTEELEKLKYKGAKIIDTFVDRRGLNPKVDIKLLLKYFKMIYDIKPDLIMTYTIKPNIYGGLVSRLTRTPYIINITGLGTTFQGNGLLKKLVVKLYKISLKKVKHVFFENEGNKHIFISNNIINEDVAVVMNGAGVNLEDYPFTEYPDDEMIRFLFIGRIMKEKGIEELLWVAEQIKQEYKHVIFDIVGSLEENYKDRLEELTRKGIVNYNGVQEDVRPFIKKCHCVILPSYHEGMSNTLLESAAMGRPLITSDIHGCREAVSENGYVCKVKDKEALLGCIKIFLNESLDRRVEMARKSRQHIEKMFDKKEVVNKSLRYINFDREDL